MRDSLKPVEFDGSIRIECGGTLRDYFAAAALQELCAFPNVRTNDWGEISEDAYKFADAMLCERQK